MSPKTPENPQQGKASDKSPEDVAEAKQESARTMRISPEGRRSVA